MRLFIAEKPSVAKAIAEELGVTGKGEGYINCGLDKITWCFGHLLELDEPDSYTPDNVPANPKTGKKIWRVEELPIIPESFRVIPKQETKKQLNIIGRLLKEAVTIVNAGDADREGQLLVDEVIDYFHNQKPVLRFWVAAHDSVSLQRGLSNMKDNKEFMGLGRVAKARSQADWLIGMNLSRAYTLSAARSGAKSLVTVGRVQTPTLKLVVDRDSEIADFKSKPFYRVKAVFSTNNTPFITNWKPSETQEGLDSELRLIDINIADAIVERVSGKEGVVCSYVKKPQTKHHPRAYSLSDITLEASNRYGLSAVQTLTACQALYETHKLTSYPRTDCSYLPESQLSDAKKILDSLLGVNPDLEMLISRVDPTIKSKTWNDKEVTVHFGIIPTMHKGSKEGLSANEKKIYELIVKRYIAQFYPLHEYESTTVSIEVDSEVFIAKGKVITQNGWQDIYSNEAVGSEVDDNDNQVLPIVHEQQKLSCVQAKRIDSKTKPPEKFTEGTLQRIMENVHQVITEVEHKKLLKEGDGIGTPATRASIINELKKRGFIEEQGKYIVSTQLGQSIVDALPEQVKSAVLTAVFERILKTIEKNPDNFNVFMKKQTDFVISQVNAANQGKISLKGVKSTAVLSDYTCTSCQKKLIRRKGKKDYWWGCSGYPECSQTYQDMKGKPKQIINEETIHA